MNEDELTLLAKMFASKNVMEGHKFMTFVFHAFDGFEIGPNEQIVVRYELVDTGIDARINWLGQEAEAMEHSAR